MIEIETTIRLAQRLGTSALKEAAALAQRRSELATDPKWKAALTIVAAAMRADTEHRRFFSANIFRRSSA